MWHAWLWYFGHWHKTPSCDWAKLMSTNKRGQRSGTYSVPFSPPMVEISFLFNGQHHDSMFVGGLNVFSKQHAVTTCGGSSQANLVQNYFLCMRLLRFFGIHYKCCKLGLWRQKDSCFCDKRGRNRKEKEERGGDIRGREANHTIPFNTTQSHAITRYLTIWCWCIESMMMMMMMMIWREA